MVPEPTGPEPPHHPGSLVEMFWVSPASMQGNNSGPSKELVSVHHPGQMPSSGGPAAIQG